MRIVCACKNTQKKIEFFIVTLFNSILDIVDHNGYGINKTGDNRNELSWSPVHLSFRVNLMFCNCDTVEFAIHVCVCVFV